MKMIVENNNSSCMIWPGYKDKQGYGQVKINGKVKYAHRMALQKKLGRELSNSEFALHNCHNASCFNPDHLRVGTKSQNNQEAAARKNTFSKKFFS